MKTKKALTKRLRVTKKNKIMCRPVDQSHFNAKESGSKTRGKRKSGTVSKSDRKLIKKLVF